MKYEMLWGIATLTRSSGLWTVYWFKRSSKDIGLFIEYFELYQHLTCTSSWFWLVSSIWEAIWSGNIRTQLLLKYWRNSTGSAVRARGWGQAIYDTTNWLFAFTEITNRTKSSCPSSIWKRVNHFLDMICLFSSIKKWTTNNNFEQTLSLPLTTRHKSNNSTLNT